MKAAVFLARLGNRMISAIVALLIITMLLYGGYSLWDTIMLFRGAFVSDDLLKYKPSGEDGADEETLEGLKAINPDVCGWLTIDDTHIDYPLVQGEDDMEYVNKDVYGDFSLSGAIFLTSENRTDFSDPYNLLFGHNMTNGAMFGDIKKFTEEDFFEEHQTGTLYLADGSSCAISIFACLETDAYDSMVYRPAAWKDAEWTELLEYLEENAVCYRDEEDTRGDRMIALSTCENAATNGRQLLFGWIGD